MAIESLPNGHVLILLRVLVEVTEEVMLLVGKFAGHMRL